MFVYVYISLSCMMRSIRIIIRIIKTTSISRNQLWSLFDFSSVLICYCDNVCMYIDNVINCESIYMYVHVLSITYTKTSVTVCMTKPVVCHEVNYDLLFNDWWSGCYIINLFTMFELKYFKQNKVVIYAKLVFSLLPNE